MKICDRLMSWFRL